VNAKLGQICVFWRAVLLGAVAVTSCLAGTIYSDLGPGGAYIVNRDYETNFDFMATPFVTTGGGSLADIVIPYWRRSAGPCPSRLLICLSDNSPNSTSPCQPERPYTQ